MLLVPNALFASIVGLSLASFCLPSQLLLGGLLLFAISCCLFCRGFPRYAYPAVFLLFFALALLRYSVAIQLPETVEELVARSKKVVVTADLLQLTEKFDNRSQLDVEVVEIVSDTGCYRATGDVRLRLYVGETVRGLYPGNRLRFKTRLRQPRLFGTPGEFHWPRYLAGQGIALTGWVKEAAQLTIVDQEKSFPLGQIAAWKEQLVTQISLAVPGFKGLLVRALLLGEARILPELARKMLAQAGVSHLFAISGLHLGLLGLFGYRLLLTVYRRFSRLTNWQPPQRVLPILLLPVLFGYLLLTGDAVSTRRAFCGALLVALFCLGRWNVHPLRLLATLALIFLLYNPLLLWQPSWQLSFAGAAGILLWQPLWQTRVEHLPAPLKFPARLLLVSTAATLATLPLVLLNFHQLAVASLPANLLAVPIIAMLVLPLGLFGVLISGIPQAAAVCFGLCGELLNFTLSLLEQLLTVPGFSAHSIFWSRWQYLAFALLLLPLLCGWQKNFRQRLLKFSVLCLCLAASCLFFGDNSHNEFALYMLSVGQGEAMLLTDGQQQAVLIDGGGLYSEHFDVGERLLAPALGELGIHSLSAVLLTHDHPDHRKGLNFILQNFPVAEFWSSKTLDRLSPRLQQNLRAQQIPVRQFLPGWTSVVSWGGRDLQLYHYPLAANENDASLVLYLPTGAGGLLLTGDLERAGVNGLLRAGLPGPVSLLKIPHHGSRYSATEKLIEQIKPQACLVSAGFNNRYGFPAKQLIGFLREKKIPLCRTDIMGSIRVMKGSTEWSVRCWQFELFR